jgi:hypothetical protein
LYLVCLRYKSGRFLAESPSQQLPGQPGTRLRTLAGAFSGIVGETSAVGAPGKLARERRPSSRAMIAGGPAFASVDYTNS